jgi:hypothetical protein
MKKYISVRFQKRSEILDYFQTLNGRCLFKILTNLNKKTYALFVAIVVIIRHLTSSPKNKSNAKIFVNLATDLVTPFSLR